MKEKKKSPNWYIAATHYLTAGFVPFLFGGIIFAFFVLFLVSIGITNDYILLTIRFLFLMAIIYLAIRYAAGYVNKTYIIEDKIRIVNLSTAYFIFLHVIIPIVLSMGVKEISIKIYSAIIYILLAFLFYVFSKKYIKNSELTPQVSEQ